MSSCMESIDNTLTKSLEAEKLHHTMVAKEMMLPIMPLHKNQEHESLTEWRKQYT